MQLSDKHIQQFQTLWEKQFGKKISKKDAYEKGVKLVHFVELVHRSMSNERHQTQKDCQPTADNSPT